MMKTLTVTLAAVFTVFAVLYYSAEYSDPADSGASKVAQACYKGFNSKSLQDRGGYLCIILPDGSIQLIPDTRK